MADKPAAVPAQKEDIVTVYYSVRLPALRKGMESETVRAMQRLLTASGYKLPRYGADGEFGTETENALLRLQEENGLKLTATCGPDEWSILLGLTGVG